MRVPIPRWADTAADWVSRHRWPSAAVVVSAVSSGIMWWLPEVSAIMLALFVGAFSAWSVCQDQRRLLEGQHDAAQVQIGRLRAQIARLEARPAAEASTKALTYIRDPQPGGDR